VARNTEDWPETGAGEWWPEILRTGQRLGWESGGQRYLGLASYWGGRVVARDTEDWPETGVGEWWPEILRTGQRLGLESSGQRY
jgi:hypothetical protein